jgi:ABC-type branched-subunit amino acid transport system ATPase component/ABC-type branched-subunit amino acid transport system permease subunit
VRAQLSSRVSGRGLAAFLAAVALAPWLSPNAYVVQVLAFAGLNVMMATGLNLLMGFAGQVSLGHAGFYGLGAYVSGVLGARLALSPWLGMPLAATVTGVLALVVGIPTLKLKSYYLAMATLGIGVVLHLVFVQLYWWTGGSSGLAGIPPFDIGPLTFASDRAHYYLIWAFAAAGLWLAWNLVNSGVGRVLRALGDSEVAAEAMGVDTALEKRRMFVLSAVYASVAGSLYAHYITVISPEIFSFLFSVVLVLMVAIGGIGRYWGPVLGALLLTVLPEYLRRYGDYEVPLYGLSLIVVMLFLPRGLAGLLDRRARAAAPGALTVAPARVSVSARGGKLLEVHGLTKFFGGVRAVHDCSFEVHAEEIKAIIGPNGAGKTTLFNLITGVYAPTGGEVWFRGRRLNGLPAHAVARLGIGRTFQNVELFPSLSVVENVMVGCVRRGPDRFLGALLGLRREAAADRDRLARALGCLAVVGLEPEAHVPAGSLPFGRQKLVEVARAVAGEPELLLLDEPAAGLNSSEKVEMIGLIGRLRDLGIAVLIIEHDMRLVMGVSDRVVVLNYGEKIAEGTPAEVQANPAVVTVYLGEDVEDVARGT